MELDDEFSVEPTPHEEVVKVTQAKSMKALYQALTAKPKGETQPRKKKAKKEEVAVEEEVQPVKAKKEKKSKVAKVAAQEVKEHVKEEKPVKKEKKDKKEKTAKVTKEEQEVSASEKKQKKIYKRKVDTSFKYVKNKMLQTQLKEKALEGVLRILNMISKTQAERNVE